MIARRSEGRTIIEVDDDELRDLVWHVHETYRRYGPPGDGARASARRILDVLEPMKELARAFRQGGEAS